MSLISLVYSSIAVNPFDRSSLQSLLHQARAFNAIHEITGLLLYRESLFIQALEGPTLAVQTLYGRIQRDPRHRMVITLLIEAIESRAYPVWAMGYRSVETDPSGGFTYSASSDALELPGTWSIAASQRLLYQFQHRASS